MKGRRLVENFLATELTAVSVNVLHQLVVSALGELLLKMFVVIKVAVVLIFKDDLFVGLGELLDRLLGWRVFYLLLYFIDIYLLGVGDYCVFLPVEFL